MDGESTLLPTDPATIGNYRIIGRLGAGGMGVVYLALSPGGRRVALKVVRRELAEDSAFRQRFENEVQAATQVHSAYTAAVIDADPYAPQPWLATSFVNGSSLSAHVQEAGPMDAADVWALGAGLAEALNAIHASGIVHRDLKPSNVLLADDGPRVIDFGIARAAQAASITQTGLMVGSPAYMAPEYVAGHGAGPEADVFALGGTVLFAATGTPPFGEGPAEAMMMRLLHEEPRFSGVDERLVRVLRRALDKDPRRRPDARSLITVFADGAEERGATMSFPRQASGGRTAGARSGPPIAPTGTEQAPARHDDRAAASPTSSPPTSPPPFAGFGPQPPARAVSASEQGGHPGAYGAGQYDQSGYEQNAYDQNAYEQSRYAPGGYSGASEPDRYGSPDDDLAYRGGSARPSSTQNAATAVLLALLCLLVGVAAFLITSAL